MGALWARRLNRRMCVEHVQLNCARGTVPWAPAAVAAVPFGGAWSPYIQGTSRGLAGCRTHATVRMASPRTRVAKTPTSREEDEVHERQEGTQHTRADRIRSASATHARHAGVCARRRRRPASGRSSRDRRRSAYVQTVSMLLIRGNTQAPRRRVSVHAGGGGPRAAGAGGGWSAAAAGWCCGRPGGRLRGGGRQAEAIRGRGRAGREDAGEGRGHGGTAWGAAGGHRTGVVLHLARLRPISHLCECVDGVGMTPHCA